MATLVTGASRGIGKAIAVRLAETRDVAVGYNESADAAAEVVDAAEERGANAESVRADVRDSAAVDRMVETVVEEFGELDAVVNNTGIVRPARITDLTDEEWREVIETNLSGAFYVSRAAAPHLQQSAGDLVNVSSIGGTGGTVDAGYAASKAGLHGLTRALARELGPDGVQVNAVAPGPVETSMNDDIVEYLESVEFRGHENVDTHLPEYACDPAEVADSVAYLLDNGYVQGEVLNVNGGMQF
jgi:3-oxoacyl-[acyl-carrier protein] reductase